MVELEILARQEAGLKLENSSLGGDDGISNVVVQCGDIGRNVRGEYVHLA